MQEVSTELNYKEQIISLRDAASLINSGGDLLTVLRYLVQAACRHAGWTMGSIMSIDAPHGYAYVMLRHDPTLLQRSLKDRWELATSPSLIALKRNEPVYIRDARVSEEFPGYRKEAFERDYRTVLVMPMQCVDADGRPMVLNVVSREIMDVSDDDLAFLGMIVHLGAIAIEKQHRLRAERLAAERLQVVLHTHTSLLQEVLAGGSIPELSATISALLPNPVVVVDFNANLLVAGKSPDESLFTHKAWQNAAVATLNRQLMKAARDAVEQPRSEPQTLFLDDGSKRFRILAKIEPLNVDAEAVGALIIFPTAQEFGDLDLLLLDSAKFALSVQMMRSFIRFRYETRTLTELFMELVEHRWRDANDLLQRSQRLGLNLSAPLQMIVVDFPENARKLAGKPVDLHHSVLRLVHQSSAQANVVAIEGGLVGLIPYEAGKGQDRAAKLMDRISEEVKRHLDQEPIVVLGNRCSAPADYPGNWERCWRMIKIARAFGRSGALSGQDFGPLPMLVAAADVGEVKGFVDECIGAIVEHDRTHDTPYLETLTAFLNEGCRSQACADAMGLHVTTLRYRLSRIQELFAIEVDTPDRRFSVDLAIRLHGVIDSRSIPQK